MPAKRPEGYITVAEYAIRYGMTAAMVYARIHLATLEYIRRGKTIFIKEAVAK